MDFMPNQIVAEAIFSVEHDVVPAEGAGKFPEHRHALVWQRRNNRSIFPSTSCENRYYTMDAFASLHPWGGLLIRCKRYADSADNL